MNKGQGFLRLHENNTKLLEKKQKRILMIAKYTYQKNELSLKLSEVAEKKLQEANAEKENAASCRRRLKNVQGTRRA